jgi:co-chaperonin GroES (HSP10)
MREESRALLDEISRVVSVDFVPMGNRLLVHPVEVDEQRMVEVVRFQRVLPDMGVVVAVSWEVNRRQVEELSRLGGDVGEVASAAMFQVGDVVCMNKFSGMDVPGTGMVAIRAEDVFGKVSGVPVRLMREGGREERKDSLVLARQMP